ncbi:MAG: hypothetical protein WCW36_02390 [Candidatus Paceibacterota bacterium]
MWQSSMRISRVVIYGADQSLAGVAIAALQGSYLGIVPRDSTFFISESRIRSSIMATSHDIAAVSIFRNGLTGLSIKIDYRVPIARWCGALPVASSTPVTDCYFFDANGFVYATTTDDMSPVNAFIVYEPLAHEGGLTSLNSIGNTLPHADKFPAAFNFARQLTTLGSPAESVVFRGDEVDDYLKSGTRITYVLGNEQNAFTALASARANLNLANGSIDYIDLRFPGKVYLKKK